MKSNCITVSVFTAAAMLLPSFGVPAEFMTYIFEGASRHIVSSPPSGHFTALNGQSFDLSDYYKAKSDLLYVKGVSLVFLSEYLLIKVPWVFDNGFSSAVYSIERSLDLGLSIVFLGERLSYELAVNNIGKIGGSISEIPCKDDFARLFHCGSGLPWVDYHNKSLDFETEVLVKVNLNF